MDLKASVSNIENRLYELGELLDVAGKKERIVQLEEKMSAPKFWDDNESAQNVINETKVLKEIVDGFEEIKEETVEVNEILELLDMEEDQQLQKELEKTIPQLEKRLEKLEMAQLLSGEYDANSAIISLHPGAGGLESQDWAEMLYRMYQRWIEKQGFKTQVWDYLSDDEGGIKSVTLSVQGNNAYGLLKGEKGVHRLVRLSPFDSSGRRHTSFASVDVIPEMKEGVDIDISNDEIKVDTYRASGAGGQHINKTDSAVRLTHIPTGIVVQCQNERSQHTNKAAAMRILAAKLAEKKRLQRQEKLDELRGDQQEIAWGSQIRSYVFHPYSLVKDHRTSVEVGNVQGVLDGDLDKFIYEYLRQRLNA
ncbi:peptide chain release factor 2 [Proteinivorax hydrogeniformans]|uniref:Peptide chain release factor 2 n=1 Tax=Proteinivorax hydrogeniformans TaxID=1826727 RepID=A0AAU8HX70_9FIRM